MLLLKNVRISFPSLWKPTSFQNEGEPKFSAVFLLPKTGEQVQLVRAEIQRVASEAFGDKAKSLVERQNTTNRKLVKDGDGPEGYTSEGEQKNGYGNHFFIKGSSKAAPKIVGRARQTLTEEDGIPYAGCMVNAQLDIWAQKNAYGSAINCKLLAVQFWADGERLGGSSSADISAFDAVEDSTAFDADVPW